MKQALLARVMKSLSVTNSAQLTLELLCLIHRHCLGHHLYSDNTQLIDNESIVNVDTLIHHLQLCIQDITRWCASRQLQLNPVKTEWICLIRPPD